MLPMNKNKGKLSFKFIDFCIILVIRKNLFWFVSQMSLKSASQEASIHWQSDSISHLALVTQQE